MNVSKVEEDPFHQHLDSIGDPQTLILDHHDHQEEQPPGPEFCLPPMPEFDFFRDEDEDDSISHTSSDAEGVPASSDKTNPRFQFINPEPHISSQFYTFNLESHSLMIRCILEGRLASPDEIKEATPPAVLTSWRSVWKDRNEDTAYLTAWKRIQDKLTVHVGEHGGDRVKSRNTVSLKKESSGSKDGSQGQIAAHTFTFRELASATTNFSPDCFLGEGGFGPVYRGRLLGTGQAVAVKQLDRNGLQGNREFLVEVLMLSLLHHPNLVNLIGYCADGDQRLLVYEFMPLGSLEDHLHDLPPEREALDWNTRMKIAAGAARGLEFLHDKANPPVIYRDFKSSNILLGDGFHPKLSDFGLAKLGPTGDKSHVSTRVMGTYGYCAPEYAMTGQLTVKSDVYSFGVVFLELITGRKAIDSTAPQGQQNLVTWARPLFNDRRKFATLADPRLEGRYPMRSLYQALAIASMCIQEQAASRPPIGDVVTALSYLANQTYDPSAGPGQSTRYYNNGERAGRVSKNEEGGVSGRSRYGELEGSEKGDSPRETQTPRMLNRDLDRERAVAEAKMWVEKRRQSAQGSFDGNSNG